LRGQDFGAWLKAIEQVERVGAVQFELEQHHGGSGDCYS
jgi:hypothetical protein